MFAAAFRTVFLQFSLQLFGILGAQKAIISSLKWGFAFCSPIVVFVARTIVFAPATLSPKKMHANPRKRYVESAEQNYLALHQASYGSVCSSSALSWVRVALGEVVPSSPPRLSPRHCGDITPGGGCKARIFPF
jgi:hypothetical protein